MAQTKSQSAPQATKSKAASAEAIKDQAIEAVERGATAVQSAVSDATETAQTELQNLSETGTKFVRENPGAAVVGALGVGVLIGLALRGRD